MGSATDWQIESSPMLEALELELDSLSPSNILEMLVCVYVTYEGAWVAQSTQCLTTDWTTGVRASDFSFSLCVRTSSTAPRASCPMGTGGPFLGPKRGRGVTLTTHPHLAPR
jgi:hypothetical protein